MKLTVEKRKLLQSKEQIILGYSQGQSLRYLANIYESSTGSIRTLLIEEGVSLRPRGRQKENK